MDQNELKDAKDVVVESSAGPSRTERNWAMACHLAGFSQIILPFPGAGVLATLILWLLKREDGALIDSQGKEALNFQISLLIYAAACLLLMTIFIGFLLSVPLVLFGFICMILGAIKASEGREYTYPLCLRFIK
ncbi:MAG: DUF4870 domain-containing protein [Pontiellaceae bacterium]|nr:DUF4870 domain-containing protein [Pontiellaceae bacterium]MBN2783409.1 DUF4870 domain-containing protein [Pontiellaceae bacterium]